jgi:FAD/FMN-containing dehydrogenase
MDEEGMVSLGHLDKIIKVDTEKLTVTVQAGARVSQVRRIGCH